MSLITSCPACGTMFRVVPDQLKISEGWVRCGHCTEVFDATAHLSEDAPASRFDDEASTRPAELPTQPAPLVPPPPAALPPMAAERQAALARQAALERAAARAAAGVEPESYESQALEETALDRPFVFRRSDLAESDAAPSVHPPLAERPASELPPDDEDAELHDVSFVRQARRKAFWRRPLVRFALSLAALALAGLLALQFAWQQHDRLAAAQPQLVPALKRMCLALGCTIGPARQIEAIVIESSGFNRLRNDTYRLSFTLRNTAPTEVEAPSMELTLTDGQDQPVLRRVLSPAELGARGTSMAAASDWSGSVGLAVAGNGGPRVAGYRLLAFYP